MEIDFDARATCSYRYANISGFFPSRHIPDSKAIRAVDPPIRIDDKGLEESVSLRLGNRFEIHAPGATTFRGRSAGGRGASRGVSAPRKTGLANGSSIVLSRVFYGRDTTVNKARSYTPGFHVVERIIAGPFGRLVSFIVIINFYEVGR